MTTSDEYPDLAGFPVIIAAKVGWGDMDAYGHMNNTRYFRLFEDVRLEYLQKIVGDQKADLQEFAVIVAATSCKFKIPLQYPDPLLVGCKITNVDESRFTMLYKVFSLRHGKVAAQGDSLMVAFDLKTSERKTIPEAVMARIRQIEGDVSLGL